jgi:hypothetical protein
MTPFFSQRGPILSRRQWLSRCGQGMGALAFAQLFAEVEGLAADGTTAPRAPHFRGRAQRVIHIFLEGGPSHVDTFDPKPALARQAGKGVSRPAVGMAGAAFPSPFAFKKYGKSGLEISDAFAALGPCADDMCVVRSMHTDEPGHDQAVLMMTVGESRFARPSFGSWVTYGLGSVSRNLPGFVVLFNENPPIQGAQNWQSAFLPGLYQGMAIDVKERQVEKMIDHIRSPHATAPEQRLQLGLLDELNRKHQAARAEDERLEARLKSFELAYRMQAETVEAFDLAREPESVKREYGNTSQGRQCLIARRLVERGVRFVQLYQGGWDHHANLTADLGRLGRFSGRAAAALLLDLKRRGLLKDTLVICSGEFGRTPTAQGNDGRDHNHRGFSLWMAGGGVKGGYVHGATDELGFEAVENKMHVHDLHATVLHLLGFDHEKLTYRYAGRDFRLTDIHGEVAKDILA